MKRRVLTRLLLAGLLLALGLVLGGGLSVAVAAETPAPGTVVVVAGTGKAGFSGDNGPAASAQVSTPLGLALDPGGNLYIADLDNNRVRRVGADGVITTVAGTGKSGSSGDNGPAIDARLNHPDYLAFDAAGNLYIAEDLGHRVRKVSPDGIITTFAGTGTTGALGDGGPATQATFKNLVDGLAVDREGNVYIAETTGHRVRKVNKEGIITTVAGNGLRGSTGDGGPATEARLNEPGDVAVDPQGNLYISEFGDLPYFGGNYGSRVRKVSPDGIITTVAGIGPKGFSGDGGPATEAQLYAPFALTVDSAGNLFISDWGNYRVRKVTPEGIISTVVGIGRAKPSDGGGSATAVALRGPAGLAVDAAGNLYIANSSFFVNDGLPEWHSIIKVYGVAAPGLIAGQPFPQPRP